MQESLIRRMPYPMHSETGYAIYSHIVCYFPSLILSVVVIIVRIMYIM
jgi:hypothetical protein